MNYGYLTHFCLTIIAQGNWTAKIKEDFFQEINSKFLAFDKGDMGWDEKAWQEASLYDPQNPQDKEEWGAWGKITLCKICEALLQHYKKIKGTNDGIILFSHSAAESNEVRDLIESIIDHKKIKKIHYLYTDHVTTKGRISVKRLQELIDQIQNKKLSWKEFLGFAQNNQLKSYINYEIIKDQYY